MGRKRKTGPSGVPMAVSLAALAVVVAWAGSAAVPRLWGLNHLAYFPLPVRLAALALAALSFVPGISRMIHGGLNRVLELLKPGGRTTAAIILISFLAAGGFYACRSASLLLGDGHMIGSTFDKSLAGDMTMNTSSVGKILANKHIEPGAAIIYLLGAKGIAAVSGATGTEGIRMINCLLGGVFVLLVLMILARGGLSGELRIWLFILVFTSGALELFFGYVEYYTPLFLCGSFYVVTAFRAIHRRGGIWLPVLLALVCIFVHIQAVLLLPSLIVLVAGRLAGRDGIFRSLTRVLGGLTAAAFAVSYLVPRSADYLRPLAGDGATPGLMSAAHGLDLLNEILLLFPLTVVFVIMATKVRKGSPGVSPADGTGGWFTLAAEWHFCGMLLFPFLMFMIFFKPEIGMARDWDLFSLVVLGAVPTALLVLNRYLAVRGRMVRTLAGPALVVGAVLAVSWVGVNASPERSAARFADILTFDASRPGYSWETLARHYQVRGNLPEAIAAQQKAVNISGNPRLVVNLCVMYRDAGMVADSKQLLRELLAVNPGYWLARSILIRQLIADREFEEGVAQAREGMKADPTLGGYYFFYGKIMLIVGRLDEAEPALREALRLGVPAAMAAEIDRMLASLPGSRN